MSRSNRLFLLLLLALFYLALMAFYGYRVGDEDLCETSSYALKLMMPHLYPNDLYLQYISSISINERMPFSYLLASLGPGSEWTYFLLHFFCTMIVLGGLYSIAARYLSKTGILLFLGSCLFLTYGWTLGGNEIWYNYVMPSLPAKAISCWALYYFLRDDRRSCYLLLIPATFLQPIVGAQLALLFLLIDGWQLVNTKTQINWKWVWPILVYGLIAGGWVLSVYLAQSNDDSLSNRHFMEIMETRLAHHYFPSYYPLKSYLVFAALYIAGIWSWRKDQKIVRFFLLAMVGYFLFAILVEGVGSASIIPLQWFKTTIWVKVLAILGILKQLERSLLPKVPHWSLAGLVGLIACMILLRFGGLLKVIPQPILHLPFAQYDSDEIDIARQVQTVTENSVCIIQPPEMTALRFFGKRSVYIDYKSNLHSRGYLAEAKKRRQEIYGLTLELRRNSLNLPQDLKESYGNLSTDTIEKQKINGATHIIMYAERELPYPIVAQNEMYRLYKI